MPDINITVAHKVAVSDTQSIVCDNSDYTVHWTLDEDWSAYDTKTMRTIYIDGTYKDTVFSGDTIELPVCTVPGVVQIGLYAGNLRTSRVAILRALPSVRSAAGAPANPTPDVYDQLMDLIKGLGGADPDDIAKAVADYLAAHPIEETDPTVPEWAKAETKPTYSAAEVGAISQSDLQAATDAALAQAKSSGEFDGATGPAGPQGHAGAPGEEGPAGADGVTPHIGDNGNWYIGSTDTGKPSRGATGANGSDGAQGEKGDTGPQGPAGAPGKDGAGMDITGATVGQIAKIAAVDASGAPTAWSPVDMPSGRGGETWELINEVTLGEDAMAVVFDKDKSGAAFALRKFAVFGWTKGSNASNTGGGSICINVANTADDRYSIVPPSFSHGALKGDQFRYWHAAAENLAEKGWRWYLTAADNTWQTNKVNIDTKLMESSQIIPKMATYLALWSRTSGDAFAAGSKIELYGVRA